MPRSVTGAALLHLHRLFVEGTLAGLTDAQLLGRFAAGRDEAAFAALVERHGPMVLGVCRAVLGDAHIAEHAFQATFLILARRSGTLRPAGESLGGYLHRVAHREARRLDAADARRRALERRAAAEAARRDATAGPDLLAAVHRAVADLPDQLRLPVVLCHLEGRTHAQAAAELRWGEATVRRRLADARSLLHARLSRAGIAPPAGLLAVLLRPDRALAADVACRSSALARAALRAAAAASPLAAAAGAMAALGRRLLGPALPARAGSCAALTLAALAMACPFSPPLATGTGEPGGGGLAGGPSPAAVAAEPAEPPASAPEPVRPDETPDDVVEVAGRVVDPGGAPVAGARVSVYQINVGEAGTMPEAVRAHADPDGRFRVRVERSALRGLDAEHVPGIDHPILAAVADGYGPAWATAPDPAGLDNVTLRLVPDDVPLDGRIIDLEGRPVPGVEVRPYSIMAAAGEDLGPVLRGEGDPNPVDLMARHALNAEIAGLPGRLVTDADGRFRLDGVGRERVVLFTIEGPTVAAEQLFAMTRPGPSVVVEGFFNPYNAPRTFLGASFEYVAVPAVPIVGIVRDERTGEPLPGVVIRSGRGLRVEATTDAEGRYRLSGVSKGDEYRVAALPKGLPYIGAGVVARDGPGLDPLTVDFSLRRGIPVRGRLVDAATGDPVRGEVTYHPFADNPHVEGLTGLGRGDDWVDWNRARAADGTFSLVVPPGRGLLAGRSAFERYVPGRGGDRVEGVDEDGIARILPSSVRPEDFESVAEVDLPADAEEITILLEFDPGRTIEGLVLDPEGRPLPGAAIAGLFSRRFPGPTTLESSSFVATALSPDHPRTLIARHEARGLGGTIILRGDEPEPVILRLSPSGGLSGRLVDAEGQPLGEVEFLQAHNPRDPLGATDPLPTRHRTDADGRFRIEGLIPGLDYFFEVRMKGERAQAINGAAIGPGEVHELGDVRVGPRS